MIFRNRTGAQPAYGAQQKGVRMSIFDPLRFSSVSMDVLACGRAIAQALAAVQKARLDTLLEAARRNSRFYREHLRAAMPGTTPLIRLPTVSRTELMDRFDDWVTDPLIKLRELRMCSADPKRIGEPYLGKYLVWESSGTIHQPGIFVQDAQALAVYDALESLRRSVPRPLQRWLDPLSLTERIAFVGAIDGHFASVIITQRLRELNPWLAASSVGGVGFTSTPTGCFGSR